MDFLKGSSVATRGTQDESTSQSESLTEETENQSPKWNPCKKCKTKENIIYVDVDRGSNVQIVCTYCGRCGWNDGLI